MNREKIKRSLSIFAWSLVLSISVVCGQGITQLKERLIQLENDTIASPQQYYSLLYDVIESPDVEQTDFEALTQAIIEHVQNRSLHAAKKTNSGSFKKGSDEQTMQATIYRHVLAQFKLVLEARKHELKERSDALIVVGKDREAQQVSAIVTRVDQVLRFIADEARSTNDLLAFIKQSNKQEAWYKSSWAKVVAILVTLTSGYLFLKARTEEPEQREYEQRPNTNPNRAMRGNVEPMPIMNNAQVPADMFQSPPSTYTGEDWKDLNNEERLNFWLTDELLKQDETVQTGVRDDGVPQEYTAADLAAIQRALTGRPDSENFNEGYGMTMAEQNTLLKMKNNSTLLNKFEIEADLFQAIASMLSPVRVCVQKKNKDGATQVVQQLLFEHFGAIASEKTIVTFVEKHGGEAIDKMICSFFDWKDQMNKQKQFKNGQNFFLRTEFSHVSRLPLINLKYFIRKVRIEVNIKDLEQCNIDEIVGLICYAGGEIGSYNRHFGDFEYDVLMLVAAYELYKRGGKEYVFEGGPGYRKFSNNIKKDDPTNVNVHAIQHCYQLIKNIYAYLLSETVEPLEALIADHAQAVTRMERQQKDKQREDEEARLKQETQEKARQRKIALDNLAKRANAKEKNEKKQINFNLSLYGQNRKGLDNINSSIPNVATAGMKWKELFAKLEEATKKVVEEQGDKIARPIRIRISVFDNVSKEEFEIDDDKEVPKEVFESGSTIQLKEIERGKEGLFQGEFDIEEDDEEE